jgi:hypothetical protein
MGSPNDMISHSHYRCCTQAGLHGAESLRGAQVEPLCLVVVSHLLMHLQGNVE